MRKILKFIKKMFMKYNNSIQRELFLSFVLINIITVTICIVILYMVTSNILTQTNKETNEKEFQQLSYNLGIVTKEVTNIIDVISTSSQIQNQANIYSLSDSSDVLNTKDTFNLFNNYLEYYPYIGSIYCYTENGTIIGKDNYSSLFLTPSEQMNLDTETFNIKTDFLKNLFTNDLYSFSEGGFSSKNFNYFIKNYTGDTNYITFARSFGSYTLQSYAILININENYFRSIYNSGVSGVDNSTYLVDNSGKIISNSDLNQINTISAAYVKNKITGKLGSYYYNDKQIVYCKVPDSSFILIRETPINVIIKEISVIRNVFIFVLLLNFISVFIFSRFFIQKIITPLKKLVYSMHKIEQGNLIQIIDEIPNNEIGILNNQFNNMSSSILELLEKNKVIEEDKRRIEIEALQTQINPHFLYNTLNTFKWLAVLSNANNVAEGLTAMGNLLRPIYNNKGSSWSLQEEYDFIQNYIKVMNYRYGGGIFVTVSFQEELMEYKVLTFMIQPILENTFTHGLKAQGNTGEISVTACSEGEDIYFEIKDNGEGMSEAKLKEIQKTLATNMTIYGKNGMSVSNVNRRIKLNYGEEYGIHIDSSVGVGTTVIIKIPKI